MIPRTVSLQNIATAVGIGGTFVAGQLLLAWLFDSQLSVPQMGGVALIFIGLMLLAWMPHSAPAVNPSGSGDRSVNQAK